MDDRNVYRPGPDNGAAGGVQPGAPIPPVPPAPAPHPGMARDPLLPPEEVTADMPNNTPDYDEQPKTSRRRGKRHEEEDEDDDYYYDDDAAHRRAGIGCLVAFLVVLAILLGAFLIGFSWYKSEIGGKHASATEPVQVEIVSGANGEAIGKVLEENDLIGSATMFRMYVKFLAEGSTKFVAGSYTVEPGMGYEEMLVLFTTLPTETRKQVEVRLRDGVTIWAMAQDLENAGLVDFDEFIEEASNLEKYSDIRFVEKLLEDYDEGVFVRAEGYIFPDTYYFFDDEGVESIVRKLYTQMDSVFTDEMYERMDELNLSVREVITFASVIQGEASHTEQQPNVARVFWNRLTGDWDRGTLGSDVTLRYVKQWMNWNLDEYKERYWSDIGYDEALEKVGEEMFYAYVTEDRDPKSIIGLPRGPIVSVTESAIRAVLWPAEDEGYYYFLTDYYGNYYYGRTLDEHNANVVTMNEQNAKWELEQEEAGDDE